MIMRLRSFIQWRDNMDSIYWIGICSLGFTGIGAIVLLILSVYQLMKLRRF